jgi:NAD(P)-dependent dehydrogenase (short-subunit alcohol dehydrogenase family)
MAEQVGMEFASYPSLRGRVAFVSGGASGLGAEFVRQLAGQGAKVAFVDVDAARGRELVTRSRRSTSRSGTISPL